MVEMPRQRRQCSSEQRESKHTTAIYAYVACMHVRFSSSSLSPPFPPTLLLSLSRLFSFFLSSLSRSVAYSLPLARSPRLRLCFSFFRTRLALFSPPLVFAFPFVCFFSRSRSVHLSPSALRDSQGGERERESGRLRVISDARDAGQE